MQFLKFQFLNDEIDRSINLSELPNKEINYQRNVCTSLRLSEFRFRRDDDGQNMFKKAPKHAYIIIKCFLNKIIKKLPEERSLRLSEFRFRRDDDDGHLMAKICCR